MRIILSIALVPRHHREEVDVVREVLDWAKSVEDRWLQCPDMQLDDVRGMHCASLLRVMILSPILSEHGRQDHRQTKRYRSRPTSARTWPFITTMHGLRRLKSRAEPHGSSRNPYPLKP